MTNAIDQERAKGLRWQWLVLLLGVLWLSPAAVGADRTIRVLNGAVTRGSVGCLSIVLEGKGDENALGFSLCYDTNQLAFVSARRGSAASGAALNVNSNQVSRGRLGCALALATGESFPAGTNPVLEVCFRATAADGIATTLVSLCDLPLAREVVNAEATTLATSYGNANVTLVGTCHYSFETSVAWGSSGGTGTVALTTDSGCPWTVGNTNAWVTINTPTNGTLSTIIRYTVAANASQYARTGVVLIAGQPLTVLQAGIFCGFTVSPAMRIHSPTGGTGQVAVQAASGACAWTVSGSNWVNVTSPTNGMGNGVVNYSVPSYSGFVARTAVVTIAEQSYQVIQLPAACPFSISPTSRMHTALSESALVNVSAPAGCDWQIVNTNNWILIKLYTNGTGDGLARYTVYANDRAQSRTGVITIAGLPFTVTQTPAPCSYSMLQTNRLLGGEGGSGAVLFGTLADCPWIVSNTNIWIQMPMVSSGVGGGRVEYEVAANFSNERSGIINVAGRQYTINQLAAGCSSSLSPATRTVTYELSTNTVNVTVGTSCSNIQWRVYNTNTWISILTPSAVFKSSTVQFMVSPRLQHTARTGMLYIADRKFTVQQDGMPCFYNFLPPSQSHSYLAETNPVVVNTDGECGWTARSDSSWLVIDSTTNGMGTGLLNYHVTLNTGAARTGRLIVSNATFTISQGAATPVTFSTQPTNQFIAVGGMASFRASASGTAPLSCQWQCNGTNLVEGPGITGATSTNLTLTNVQPAQAGNYTIIVSNVRGPATSSPPAVLRVNTPPGLPPLADKCVVNGMPLTFTVAAVDSDLPAQKLTYTLASGAPLGATINSSSGLFNWNAAWTPGQGALPVTVRVADNGIPPLTNSRTFSITVAPASVTNMNIVVAPTNGSMLAIGDSLPISVQVSDVNRAIVRLEYYFDGDLVGSGTLPPYAMALNPAPAGLHVVQTRALDICGTSATSAPNYLLVAPQGAQVLFQPGFTSSSGLAMSGAAVVQTNELFLTRVNNSQSSAVWSTRKAYLAEGFETAFRFRISVPSGNTGGEGFAFVLQNSAPGAIGSGGADLGYGGIPNSLAVEFDTALSPALGDLDDNHISIHTMGILANSAGETASLAQAINLPNLSDGNVHVAKIDYLPNRLRVFLDDLASPILILETNLASVLNLDNGRAWAGFTASTTSAAFESHEILAWSLVTTNLPPIVSLTSPTNGARFVSPAAIPLTADAVDTDDRVARLEFFLGGTSLGTATGPSYSMIWSNVPPGNYVFAARATDNHGLISTSAPVNVSVVFVNKAPTFAAGPDQVVLEDSGARFVSRWASAISAGPPDEAAQVVSFVVTNDNPGLFAVQPSVNPDGNLAFTPAPDAFGLATVSVVLRDNGGTANDGHDTSVPATFTVRVKPVNDAPSFTRGTNQIVVEDSGLQAILDWATQIRAGPTNESSQLLSFTVTTDNASLFSVQPALSTNGMLRYAPEPDRFGVAVVQVILKDDGGTNDDGREFSSLQSFSITVLPVNDPPSFNPGSDLTVLEDAGPQVITNWATSLSPGPPNESAQALAFIVTNDNPNLFALQPRLDSGGTLFFTTAPDAFGVASVTVALRDDGGTNNGGMDTGAPRTFAIQVTPVNDPPSFAKGLNLFVLNNAGPQYLPGWARRIRPGPSNESNQLVHFELATDNPGLFSVLPVLTPEGTLTYTPNANGLGTANVQVVIMDNGGTNNGGIDIGIPQSFKISVVTNLPPDVTLLTPLDGATFVSPATIPLAAEATDLDGIAHLELFSGTNILASFAHAPFVTVWSNVPPGDYVLTAFATDNRGLSAPSLPANIQVLFVNKPPSFLPGPDQSVLEDCGPVFVSRWATALSPGPPDEAGEVLTFLVTNDSPSLFISQPSIDAEGKLSFTPAPDAFGVASVTVLLRDDAGTANGGRDTSPPATFVIRIQSVNDPPVFVNGPNPVVLEDAGPQNIPGWATQIRAGPPNEDNQSVEFAVTTDKPGMFIAQPALTPDGTLYFTAAPDVFGVATVYASLRDDGGTNYGGRNNSGLHTFTITVMPVNDPPGFTAGHDVMVVEDGGSKVITNWATNVRSGPSNEFAQSLTFVVSNDLPALFSTPPAIDARGSLSFTPAPDAFGRATVSVRLQDDGGTADGGMDSSGTVFFSIVVLSANDPPTFVRGPNQSVLEDSGLQTVPGWASQIRAGPSNETGQHVTFGLSTDNPALFSQQPSLTPDGTLTYAPAPDLNGSCTVQVTIRDDGGTNFGGVNFSTQAFTITVVPVNDSPSFTSGADQLMLEDGGLRLVTNWATNIRFGPANESGQLLHFELAACDNVPLFSELPSLTSNGTLRYTPAPDAVGTSRITFVLKDDGGTNNGGRESSTAHSFTITVFPVNDPPSFVPGTNIVAVEDSGAQVLHNWASHILPGPSDESGQSVQFRMVSCDNVALFSELPSLAPDGTLRFAAAHDAFGTCRATFILVDDGGTSDGGHDTSGEQTVTITVLPVNDPPAFIAGPDLVVSEDAGSQVVPGWAKSIRLGPQNEVQAGQSIEFVVHNDNSALFSSPPAVAPNGTLTFTPAPDANGVASVTVFLRDNGGTAQGGQDTSPEEIFTITVLPVNDAPTFTKGPNLTVLDNAGPQVIPNWARNLSVGPPDESTQQLTIRVVNDNHLLFASTPVLDLAGTLYFEPIPDVIGSALVSVILEDDGGIENGGTPISSPVSFRIIVQLSNRPPDADPGATAFRVISPNNTNAAVVLDGSKSSDPEGDPLHFAWFETGAITPFATGIRATNVFPIGPHPIVMLVDDGRHAVTAGIEINVIYACESVDDVLMLMEGASMDRRNKRPFIATLKASCASFDRGQFKAGANQLYAFINKVRAAIQPTDPVLADECIRRAQEIIDAVQVP